MTAHRGRGRGERGKPRAALDGSEYFYEDDGSGEPGLRSDEDIAAWPWRIDITMLLSLWHAHRGPTIDAVGIPSTTMRRRSHLRLSEEQYLEGIEALAAVARP